MAKSTLYTPLLRTFTNYFFLFFGLNYCTEVCTLKNGRLRGLCQKRIKKIVLLVYVHVYFNFIQKYKTEHLL